MALVQATFMSHALSRNVTVTAILPETQMGIPRKPLSEKKPFKTLYLLHGIFGNHADWSWHKGPCARRRYNLAVIMPSADNSFYLDDEARGNMYGEFIGVDLVEATREMFRCPTGVRDTFIAGLSMGGYGAIRNGLKYCETFSHVAELSSALITYNAPEATEDNPWNLRKGYFRGDLRRSGKAPRER